ncbi:hypothetical protein B0A55_01727 [Friedmanniomyces simplex]|uniref:Apple domain-containing protein n=1 Tax=Friedmanniomyces simplex TaxID=329884 RepID=A0A4U0Y3A2_9PEZI|nr:hypothetical protein B0A55_01727 [Friedmanniomyces simplex]
MAQTKFTCPDDNGQSVTDSFGIQYYIGCMNDTSEGNYASGPAANSFNDCITGCSNASDCPTAGGAGYCTAATYQGGANGVGPGNCYYKYFATESFTSGNPDLVGVIRAANYQAANAPAAGPTFNGPSWTCPAQDQTLVMDPNGVQYVIGCGTDSTTSSYASYSTSVGFDDFFAMCSNGTYPTTSGAGHCTAFTYVGGTNGVGQGTCYYKNGVTESFSGSGSGFVAAARYDAYSGPAPTSTIGGSGSSGPTSTAAAANNAASSSSVSEDTVTYTTVSYAAQTTTSFATQTLTTTGTVTTTSVTSYFTTVVSTAVSKEVQTYTTSYVQTSTYVSTLPGTIITATSTYSYGVTATEPASTVTCEFEH